MLLGVPGACLLVPTEPEDVGQEPSRALTGWARPGHAGQQFAAIDRTRGRHDLASEPRGSGQAFGRISPSERVPVAKFLG